MVTEVHESFSPLSSVRAAPTIRLFEIALNICFHILIKETEKLTLDSELNSCTHFKVM
jgi:hypothetical protein